MEKNILFFFFGATVNGGGVKTEKRRNTESRLDTAERQVFHAVLIVCLSSGCHADQNEDTFLISFHLDVALAVSEENTNRWMFGPEAKKAMLGVVHELEHLNWQLINHHVDG